MVTIEESHFGLSPTEAQQMQSLKIRNHLLFVINIINLLEVQYSISINWLLILILILRLQIHEIVKIQNSVMNLQAIL